MLTDYYSVGVDACGAEEGGSWTATPDFDAGVKKLSARVREMSRLKRPTVAISRLFLRAGQAAVDDAVREAVRSGKVPLWAYATPLTWALGKFKASQAPSTTSRQKVYGKLRWHEEALDKLAGSPDALYPHEADLKNWVAQAFVEDVATRGEADLLDGMWTAMWGEIGRGIADAATRIKDVAAAPFIAIEKAFRLPGWLWILGGALLLGALGFGAYKVLLAAAPVAVGRYLPRGT